MSRFRAITRTDGGNPLGYRVEKKIYIYKKEGGRGPSDREISGTIGLSSFLVARSTPTRG